MKHHVYKLMYVQLVCNKKLHDFFQKNVGVKIYVILSCQEFEKSLKIELDSTLPILIA